MTAVISDTASGTRGDTDMYGRDEQRRAVTELLRKAGAGAGGVLLVEGEQGMGKSSLLAEAAREASTQGFSLAIGATDRLGGRMPLFSLPMAVGIVGADTEPARWPSQIARLRERLVRWAETAPVLVSLDDVQWAHQETMLALRVLPCELTRYPIAWIMCRSAANRAKDSEYLFDALEKEGARRVSLQRLDDNVVTAMLGAAFGAPPDAPLLRLAEGAGGNPALLADLIGGLRDEDMIRVVGGGTTLVAERVPTRVVRGARQRLDDVSELARRVLETAAVMGSQFRLGDIAAVLDMAPGALLPGVEEALRAGLLEAGDDTFSFRYGLIARATAQSVPGGMRRVLHRQLGEILLARASMAAEAARHLLKGATSDDPGSLATLDNGVAQTLPGTPRIAADLALRAWQLTGHADRAAIPRAVAATEALTAAGRLTQAATIVEQTLAHLVPGPLEVRLRAARASILTLTGQTAAAIAEAEKALTLSDGGPHGHALSAWLQTGDRDGQIAADVLAAPAGHSGHLLAAAATTRAMLTWKEGRCTEAVELLREVTRQWPGVSRDARDVQPGLLLAARLIDMYRTEEASAILNGAEGEGGLTSVVVSVLRARLHLVSGRPQEAGQEAQAAVDAAERVGADAYASVARSLLALIALREGNLHDAARQLADVTVTPPYAAAAYAPAETALVQARIIEAKQGAGAVIGQLRELCADRQALNPVLLGDPALAVWLVRTALAAGDREVASTIASAVETHAPDNPAIMAAAAHARGLLAEDEESLAEAITRHRSPWARASAVEDLALLHAGREARELAVERLDEALGGYRASGATADMARVRARLRALGVRRRHWEGASGRPADGWESLTHTEQAVCELIAEGLTNRQAANRMYLSVHTVSHHLRQAFRKLRIRSRVELVRIVVERSQQVPVA